MRLFVTITAAACLVVPAALLAQDRVSGNDRVLVAPAPDWAAVPDLLPVPDNPRGIVFVRGSLSEVRLDDEGQTSFASMHLRLLQPNALQFGNIAIPWNPAAGAAAVHSLKVHRDGTVRDVLAETEFDILRREDNLEEAMLSGVLTAVLRVPDLRVGDELELAYSVRQKDPTLGADSAGLLFLAGSPAPGRFRLRLSWEDGQEPTVRLTPDLEPLTARTANAITIDADMPGPVAAPKNAPPRYGWQRIAEFSDFADWPAISRRFQPLYAEAARLEPGSPIKQEAERIAAAHRDPLARAAVALDLVQQQVRYIYVGLNDGNLKPASADLTWQRRYGDCKGKTALLLALLRELGIEAEVVLAANEGDDDGLELRLPNPGMFDHVLVRARIGGKTYWLDGTLPKVVPPTLAPSIPYRWVLPLSAGGTGLERQAWKPLERPDTLVLYEIDARAGFDQPAQLKTTIVTRGPEALAEYMRFSAITDEQLEEAYRQNAEGGHTWDTIDKVTWRFDEPTQASVLTIAGSGPLDWQNGRGGRYMTLPGGGFSSPERQQRGSGQDQDAPFYASPEFSCHVTTVRLPEETKTTDWSYNSHFNTVMFGRVYRRSFERREGEITMLRQFRVMRTEISPRDAAADNARLAEFDNSMARITHYPDDPLDLTSQETVPATHAIDWVSNDTACLAPVKKTR
jgi:transglutaminase-like putative cysteine protease